MKRLFRYIAALTLLISLTSCVDDTFVDMPNRPLKPQNAICISGTVVPFDSKVVTTRANGNSNQPNDLYISGMTMFVFDNTGKLIEAYSNDRFNEDDRIPSSAVTIKEPNPTFMIDKTSYADNNIGIIASIDDGTASKYYFKTDEQSLAACEIYIVANLWHLFEGYAGSYVLKDIQSKTDLLNFVIQVDNTLAMPKHPTTGEWLGFPMIGTVSPDANGNPTTFDLRSEDESGKPVGMGNAVATIPMKKLFSKIDFRLKVKANQVIENGDMPQFEIDRVEVFNIPTLALMSAGQPIEGDLEPGKTDSPKDKWIQGYADTDGSDYQHNASIAAAATAKGVPLYQFMDSKTNPNMEDTNGSFTITNFNRTITTHDVSENPQYIEFGFYMPEHYVDPQYKTVPEPGENWTEAEKIAYYQQMKPMYMRQEGVNEKGERTYTERQKATFIRLHGHYTDHHGQIFAVSYDVYLGHNHTNDFNIERNCLLTNYLTITGITNHNQAGENTISLDHRVDVEEVGFTIAQEREALLDAHYEVRPVDITLSGGSSMVITIPADASTWISMESDRAPFENENYYCNKTDGRRVRKYFTTNLIGELNAELPDGPAGPNGTAAQTLTIENTDKDKANTYRVWFYIDENPNVYDPSGKGKQTFETGNYTVYTKDTDSPKKQFRDASIKFSYIVNDTARKETEIKFQQHNLWRVWNIAGTRFYDIEVEEEYLTNYAADSHYGETQNGMPWGLDGVPLSTEVKAFSVDQDHGDSSNIFEAIWILIQNIVEYVIENAVDENKPLYDFYNTSAEVEECRLTPNEGVNFFPYNGLGFTKKIIQTADVDDGIANLTLIGDPSSAVEYCYHKNKRDDEYGGMNVADIHWYLPAIDEIQEICAAAYAEFDGVFQNNFYWSSQPAYMKAKYTAYGVVLWGLFSVSRNGFLYHDNVNYARATRAKANADGSFDETSFATSAMDLQDNTYSQNSDDEYWTLREGENGVQMYPASNSWIDHVDEGYKNRTTDMCRIRSVYRSSENIKKGLQ